MEMDNEYLYSSETSVLIYQTARCRKPEVRNMNLHGRESFIKQMKQEETNIYTSNIRAGSLLIKLCGLCELSAKSRRIICVVR
jgi:hypothetical protein